MSGALWIETGTFRGDTAQFLSEISQRVITIEPDETLFAMAQKRFESTPTVTCIRGTSEEVFDDVCSAISGPVNFWLDGHYSSGKTFQGDIDTPIEFELGVISRYVEKLRPFSVFIDDVRCFATSDPMFVDYPSVDYLVRFALEHGLEWSVEHDIFIARSS